MTDDKEDKKFQKELAYHQIGATLFATVGSVLIAIGVSIFIFSEGINLDATDKKVKHINSFNNCKIMKVWKERSL